MFAYCSNSPVNLYDNSGTAPQAIEDKMVHDMVLANICGANGNLSCINTCIYYNGTDFWGGWGFCDLYNTITGEVWELKKNSSSRSCRTSAALAQLTKYVSGRLKHNKSLPLCLPYITTISSGHFSFEANGYIYTVNYWSESNGILRYDYTKRKTDTRKAVEAFVAVAALTALVVVAPYTAPAAGGAGLAVVCMI